MQIMLSRRRARLLTVISLLNRLLLLSSSLKAVDCAGQRSQVSDKRTAASNRLRGHLAISQSNTASAIELTEMKERICAGFKFKAGGVNCSFQMAKESVAIAKLFGECRDIMISRCRRKQSEFFCEKGKQNALKINRSSNTFANERSETLSTIDCFLPDQDRFAPLYGTAIQSYAKCCSVCQKAKLYAIELSSCKHKYYAEPILEQTFSDCCYSRLYQSRPNSPLNTVSGLFGPSTFSLAVPTTGQSNDYPLNTVLATDQDEKGSAALSVAQLAPQLAHMTAENSALDNLISSSSRLPNNANSQFSTSSSSVAASKVLSSILAGDSSSVPAWQQALQHLNHMVHPPSNSRIVLPPNLIEGPLDRSIERSPIDHTKEIVQQLKLHVDIEKLYLSKAKLLLALRRNETIITNLTEDERNLLLKALDTSKLDAAIKRLTGLLQPNGTLSGGQTGLYAFDMHPPGSFQTDSAQSLHPASNLLSESSLQASSYRPTLANLQAASNQQPSNSTSNDLADEFANRPLAASSTGSLIDQLQSLLGANKWTANGSVDHYANLPSEEESSLLDDDLDTVNPILYL